MSRFEDEMEPTSTFFSRSSKTSWFRTGQIQDRKDGTIWDSREDNCYIARSLDTKGGRLQR